MRAEGSDYDTLFLETVADDSARFLQVELSQSDLALYAKAGYDSAIHNFKGDTIVFNGHESVTTRTAEDEFTLNPQTQELLVDPKSIISQSFAEVQNCVNQVLGAEINKKLGLTDIGRWEMLATQIASSGSEDMLTLECFWRLNPLGLRDLSKKRNFTLKLIGLEQFRGDAETTATIMDLLKDSVAFCIEVQLRQNPENAAHLQALAKVEEQTMRATKDRQRAQERKMNTNLRNSAKTQNANRRAANKGQRGADRRGVQKSARLAGAEEMTNIRKLAKTRRLQPTEIELPTVNIQAVEALSSEQLKDSFDLVLPENLRATLAKIEFRLNPDSHIAKSLSPEDFDLIRGQFPAYLDFLRTLNTAPEAIYPREFVFETLSKEDQDALEAFEKCLQFMFAQDQDWIALASLQQHLRVGNGLGAQQPNRPLNHNSTLSLINQDIEVMVFAMEQGLDRTTENGERLYQSSIQLHSAWGKVIDDNYEGVGKKTKIQFCMNAIKAAHYNFDDLDPWRQIVIDGIQHINAVQTFAGPSAKLDMAALMRQLCQYNDAKPSKNERTFIGIIATRYTEDNLDFFNESRRQYIHETRGLSDKGQELD